MRTNIVIDDELMMQAMQVTGITTKREAVERGLQLLLQLGRQSEALRWRGKLEWVGDLDAMRTDD